MQNECKYDQVWKKTHKTKLIMLIISDYAELALIYSGKRLKKLAPVYHVYRHDFPLGFHI